MDRIIFTSISIPEFKSLITESIKDCLKQNSSGLIKSNPSYDKWLSISELCNYLPGHPAKATIYSKVSKRQIPHKKMDGRLAFLKSEIDNWLQSKGRKTHVEIEADVEENLSNNSKRK